MLPKKHRLNKKRDFKMIYKNRRALFSPLLTILTLKYKQNHPIKPNLNDNSRFGFIVSNKVAKKTVIRNRLKRQLRSIVHHQLKYLSSDFACIVIARPKIKEASYQAIKKSLEELLKRAGLYQDSIFR